ncbi:uncharacterized protein IL334_000757 [Kwoniella shivajii]|uniref:Uncharacterized protein n=1 Tax=Kwoniella shivajii TaxID=564305 RepID=A0ABZ1CQ17_9TREE|nr:hypothetical protein IL334_000757 [Kwoniella shivajii]
MQPRRIPPSSSGGEDNPITFDSEMASPPNDDTFSQNRVNYRMKSKNQPLTPPIRFATTTNAFGLSSSSSSSSTLSNMNVVNTASTRDVPLIIPNGPVFGVSGMRVDISPPSAGSITTRKLRRPSMLSLQQNISFSSDNSGKADDESTPIPPNSSPADISIINQDHNNQNVLNTIQDPSSSKTISKIIAGSNQYQNQLSTGTSNPFNANTIQPTPRWAGNGGSFANALIRRTTSAPIIPFEDLKTSTPPLSSVSQLPRETPMDMEEDEDDEEDKSSSSKSPLKWIPTHLKSSSLSLGRKGKGKMDDDISLSPTKTATAISSASTTGAPTFTGRPLSNALLQTLASEERPLDHEMQSEARLQRFLLSHPQKLPLTPRAPKGSRGRFPDQVGGDDDDEENNFPNLGPARRSTSWTATRRNWMDRARFDDSDTDSDEEEELIGGKEEPVNSAFAAGMDMDRPTSSSSSNMWISHNNSSEDSGTGTYTGKSTPPKLDHQQQQHSHLQQYHHQQSQQIGIGNPFPTPPSTNGPFAPNTSSNSNFRSGRLSFSSTGQGMVPSPGFGLPSAFGGLGMGGIGTPLASPTVERVELGASPGATTGGNGGMNVSSPGLMLYRESQGGQATVRSGKRKAQVEDRFDPYKRPRGSSPSLINSSPFPLSPSRTSSIPIPQSPSHAPLYPSTLSSLSTSLQRHTRPAHPYTRPMANRSRAASPALSIGSAGGLSSSLGNKGNGNPGGGGGQQLGGLGLLSIQHSVNEEDEREGTGEDMRREDSGERMEED